MFHLNILVIYSRATAERRPSRIFLMLFTSHMNHLLIPISNF